MTFQLAHAENFPIELACVPQKVRKAWQKVVLPVLRDAPDTSDPPKVKKLDGYKNLWRLRVSDEYRLVYRVDRSANVVTALIVGHRNTIYDRLGANAAGQPGIRIVARAEELLEREPTLEEVGSAEMQLGLEAQPPSSPDSLLITPLTVDSLCTWAIPAEFHSTLLKVSTEGQLLGLGSVIPEDIMQRVLCGLYPPPIEDVIQQPIRLAADAADIEAASEGLLSLQSFLLQLDDNQEAFVARFQAENPRGPWLLKGGPGSGKSTVALYCIRALALQAAVGKDHTNNPLRILFTTFSKSLIKASDHLLASLGIDATGAEIDVTNVDKLSFQFLPAEWRGYAIQHNLEGYVARGVADCLMADPEFGFDDSDVGFLSEEIDWVIVGQGIESRLEYGKTERTGRGRALTQLQRQRVWDLFEVVETHLRNDNVCLFSERLREAARHVVPEYDYVFIDEAQDLKPIAIRFCIGLCKDPKGVFLTADTNQSIYGNGLSWTKVAADLHFKGRARILRRNYRTTSEIWGAVTQLTADEPQYDAETLDVDAMLAGVYPTLAWYSNIDEVATRLNRFLHEALRTERVGIGCAAVLCKTRKELNSIAPRVDKHFNARVMGRGDSDMDYLGVKLMTMHAAKGLQFPVVAVLGLEQGMLPATSPESADSADSIARDKRILFVACSRAMRRLIVFASREHPSPFASRFSDEYWDIEDL